MGVPIRDAATVMVVRDAVDDEGAPAVEVCMLQRNLSSEFLSGAYVFPGGSVDPEDRGAPAEALCRGRTDAEASALLGLASGGLAFWVAALRECFEEAGVMLARRSDVDHPDGGPFVDTRAPEVAARFAAYRNAVNDGSTRLLVVCAQEGLVLAADTVHYVSHWITPELAPKRYDTRFFITAAPPDQIARHDDGETIASIWVRPADALDRHNKGELDLLHPTVANLTSIQPFHTTAEVMAWASEITEVPTIMPIVVFEDGRALVLRPGDEGYTEALANRRASGSQMDEELSEAAKSIWGPKPGAS
jgi:8-oxo-dGTP pyrophosphatase MutT (NUDIX family)